MTKNEEAALREFARAVEAALKTATSGKHTVADRHNALVRRLTHAALTLREKLE